MWLPSVVLFELRYRPVVHPDASRRRKLELAIKRMMAELIQERISPFDQRAAEKAAQLAAQRKTQGRPVDLRDTLDRRHRSGAAGPAGHAQQPPLQ